VPLPVCCAVIVLQSGGEYPAATDSMMCDDFRSFQIMKSYPVARIHPKTHVGRNVSGEVRLETCLPAPFNAVQQASVGAISSIDSAGDNGVAQGLP